MNGPYPRFYELPEMDDATATAMHVLKQYAICKRENIPDTMKILAWLEDNHPLLEEACEEMRITFTIPPWDRELRKLLGISAFNSITDVLKKNRSLEVQYSAQSSSQSIASVAA